MPNFNRGDIVRTSTAKAPATVIDGPDKDGFYVLFTSEERYRIHHGSNIGLVSQSDSIAEDTLISRLDHLEARLDKLVTNVSDDHDVIIDREYRRDQEIAEHRERLDSQLADIRGLNDRMANVETHVLTQVGTLDNLNSRLNVTNGMVTALSDWRKS